MGTGFHEHSQNISDELIFHRIVEVQQFDISLGQHYPNIDMLLNIIILSKAQQNEILVKHGCFVYVADILVYTSYLLA